MAEVGGGFNIPVNIVWKQEGLEALLTQAKAEIQKLVQAANVAPPGQQAGYARAIQQVAGGFQTQAETYKAEDPSGYRRAATQFSKSLTRQFDTAARELEGAFKENRLILPDTAGARRKIAGGDTSSAPKDYADRAARIGERQALEATRGNQERAARANAIADDPARVRTYVEEDLARQRLTTAIAKEAALSTQLASSRAEELGARARAKGKEAEALLAHPTAIADIAKSQLAQRQVSLQTRQDVAAGTNVGQEAATNYLEGITRRRIAIAQAKLEQDAAVVSQIASEKVEQEKLNQLVRAEVRRRSNVQDAAKDRLGERRFGEEVKLSELQQQGPQDYTRAASVAVEERRRKTEIGLAEQNELRTATGQALVQAEQRLTRLTAESAAEKAEMLATDSAYIAATVRQAQAKEELTARTVLVRNGEGDPAGGRDALIARASVLRKAESDRRAAAAVDQTTNAEIELGVQKKVAEARLNNAIRVREREIIKQSIADGELGGTRFQRIQARLSPTGRTPEEFATGGQFIGQKLATTAGYAAAGVATGALIFGVKTALDQAEELQQTFTLLKSQLDGIGKADSFGEVSDRIRGIAADTGISTEKVAEFAARLIGVFRDPDRALNETEAAMKLSVVTGTDLNTMLQDLVPTATQFGTSIERIGDLAVAIRERFGIAEGALTDFLGKTAAVAQQAGLSIEEVAVIGSAAANSLGKDMGSIADLLARVIPGLTGAQDKLYAVYQSKPQTANLVEPLAKAFGAGDTGAVFRQVLTSYNQLDSVQKKYLVNSLAERREAPLLTAVLADNKEILDELSAGHLSAEATAGKLNGRFANLQETVKNAEERIKEAFNQLGEALFNSGLADFFYDLASAIKTVIGLAGEVVKVFGKLDDATKFLTGPAGLDNGLLRTLLQFVATAALANRAFGVLSAAKSGDAESSTVASRALQRLVGAKATDTAASTEDAAAEERLTATRVADTEATGAETVTVEANTAAKRLAGTADAYKALPGNALGTPLARNSAADFENLYTGAAPAAAAKYGLAAKALQGGSLLKFGGADAAATAATGAAPGASGAGIAAIVLAGALITKNSYDGNQEGYKAQSNDLVEKIKGKDRKKIQALLDQHESFIEGLRSSVAETLFREDNYRTVLEKEANRQDSASGTKTVGGLIDSGKGGDFAKRISDANLKQINDFFNQSSATKGLGAEVGFDQAGRNELTGDSWFNNAQSVNVTRDKLAASLPELKKRAEAGDKAAGEAVLSIETVLKGQHDLVDLAREAQDAANKGDINKAIDLAGGADNFAIQTFEEAKQQHDLGKLTDADYLNEIAKRRATLVSQLSGAGAGDRTKVMNQIFQVDKETRDLEDRVIQQRADSLKLFVGFSGSTTPKTDQFQISLNAFKQESQSAQFAALPKLLQDNYDAWQERLEKISDPVARANEESKGVPIPKELRKASFEQQLSGSTEAAGALGRVVDDLNKTGAFTNADELRSQVTKYAADNNVSVAEAVRQMLEQRIKFLKDTFKFSEDDPLIQMLRKAQENADQAFSGVDNLPDVQKMANDARRKGDLERTLKNQKGALDLQAARAGDDSIAQANIAVSQSLLDLNNAETSFTEGLGATQGDVDSARAAYERSKLAQSKAIDDVTRATLQWGIVLANGDPVKENAAKMEIAQFNLSAAIKNQDQTGIITAQQEIQRLQFEANDQAVGLANAQLSIMAAQVERDPVAAAQVALQQADNTLANAKGDEAKANAEADRIRAQHQLEDAVNAASDSQLDVTAALVERDPLATAKIALQKADAAAARAVGTAAQNEAEAERIRAQHQIEDAIRAALDAQTNLAIAIAESAGDSVGAAKIALDAAKARLDEALARGADPLGVEVSGLKQEFVTKQAALRDQKLSEREAAIEFMSQMGQITTSQAVAMYQDLLQVPDIIPEARRQIELKIHELQGQMKQDFQFNLPTTLGLPTLYEARRATQTAGGVGGYTDNRQVSVTVNVNNANDLAAVERMLGDNLGTNRYATTVSKRY